MGSVGDLLVLVQLSKGWLETGSWREGAGKAPGGSQRGERLSEKTGGGGMEQRLKQEKTVQESRGQDSGRMGDVDGEVIKDLAGWLEIIP